MYRIAGSEEVAKLRLSMRQQYVSHHTLKLTALIRWAQQESVDLLVFPEYSVPAESLPALKRIVTNGRTTVVAGSHTVSNVANVINAYTDCGFNIGPDSIDPGAAVRTSVAPVLFPDGTHRLVYKMQRSRYEGDLVTTDGVWSPVTVPYTGGQVGVAVLLCIDALSAEVQAVVEAAIAAYPIPVHVLAVPALSPSTSPYRASGILSRLNERAMIFANASLFGGSALFVQSGLGTTIAWPGLEDGLIAAKNEEVVIMCDIDPTSQFEKRQTVVTHVSALRPVAAPIVYQSEAAQLMELDTRLAAILDSIGKSDLNGAAEAAKILLTDSEQFLPHITTSCINYLIHDLLPMGVTFNDAHELLLNAHIEPSVASTRQLRYSLINMAQSSLIESLKVGLQSGLDITHLSGMLAFIDQCLHTVNGSKPVIQESYRYILKQPTGEHDGSSPVFYQPSNHDLASWSDRTDFLSWLQVVSRDRSRRVSFVVGPEGIGKSYGVTAGFAKKLPDWRIIRVECGEDWGIPRLISEIAERLGTYADVDKAANLPDTALTSLVRRILRGLDKHEKVALLLDRFHNVILREADRGGKKITAFMRGILERDSYRGNPVIVTSTLPVLPPLVPEDMQDLVRGHRLPALDKDIYIANIIRYWYRLKPSRKGGDDERPIGTDLLKMINGHPLAARMATDFIDSERDVEYLGQLADHEELSRKIVNVLLKTISLTPAEKACASFVSVFRGDVPVTAIDVWGGDDAHRTLAGLESKFLATVTNGFAQVHPAIKRHFRNQLTANQAEEFHNIALEHYIDEILQQDQAGRLSITIISEASYHAGATGNIETLSRLRYRYVDELKRSAKNIYLSKRYDLALEWYEALNDMQPHDSDILAYCARCCHRIAAQLLKRREPIEDYDMEGIGSTDFDEHSGLSEDDRHEQAVMFRNRAEHYFEEARAAVASGQNKWVILRDYAHALVATHNPKWNPEKYRYAEELFKQVREEYGQTMDPGTEAGLAYMHLKEGHVDQAEELFSSVLDDIDFAHRFSLYHMCKITWGQKRNEEFDKYLDRLRLYHPDDDMTGQILDMSNRI